MLDLLLAFSSGTISTPAPLPAPRAFVIAAEGDAHQDLGAFVENVGQWQPGIHFQAVSGNVALALYDDGFSVRRVALLNRDTDALSGLEYEATDILRFQFEDSPVARVVEACAPQSTRFNYHLAHGSFAGARGFEEAWIRDVQPGVHLRFRRDSVRRFAFDVHVDSGVGAAGLSIHVHGGTPSVDGGQELVVHGASDSLELAVGASWETNPISGSTRAVSARFRASPADDALVHLEVPERDPSCALVIDPTLQFLGYHGNQIGQPGPESLDVAPDGSLLIGTEHSADLFSVATPGAFQSSTVGPGNDSLVLRFTPGAESLEWATFLGGDMSEQHTKALWRDDGVCVVGSTWSHDFPLTEGALQQSISGPEGSSDARFSMLSSDGATLIWSTLYGGNHWDTLEAAQLDPTGAIVFALAHSTIFPDPIGIAVSPGAHDEVYDEKDKLIARLAADGSQILGSTWFHGYFADDVAVAPSGDVYLAGSVSSQDLEIPTTPGVLDETPEPGQSTEGYVARFDPSCTQLRWCTYIGALDGLSSVRGLGVDAAGAVYVTVDASTHTLPVTPGALLPDWSTAEGGWAAKILPEATGFAWATYLAELESGSLGYGHAIQSDPAGSAVVMAFANGSGWQVTPDAFQQGFVGPFPSSDLVLAKLDAVGESFEYCTYFGGNGGDGFPELHVGTGGLAHFAFQTYSTDLPTTPGVLQPANGGVSDLGLAAFDLGLEPWRVLGYGLKGSREVPNLVGLGPNVPGTTSRLALRGAEPNVPLWIAAGLSEVYVALLSGVLVPFPDASVKLTSDSLGWADLTFTWPNLPAGVPITFQAWCLDLASPNLFSASNALRGIGS